MPRVGVITGTRREAACLRHQPHGDRFEIACSGADAARAKERTDALLSAGCKALLSFGVAGGLDPALAPGTVIVAETVITPGGNAIETDSAWRAAVVAELGAAGIGFAAGSVIGADRPVSDPEPKRLLFEGTGGRAVDMESHVAVAAARRGGVPVIAVRAVADAAADTLPEIAMAAIGRRGQVRYGMLAARLMRQPRDLGQLMKLARLSRPAFDSLRRVAALPSLGGPF